jgi:hypothetical protein
MILVDTPEKVCPASRFRQKETYIYVRMRLPEEGRCDSVREKPSRSMS